MEKVRVLLWGIGSKYNQVRNLLRLYESMNQIEIVGITANQLPPYSKIDGYTLIENKCIGKLVYDYIMVLSDKFFDDIVNEAIETLNISRDKFIKSDVLFIPNLNFVDYIRLKESRISIISNNCWGGVIYNTLGFECRSPFKNLFVLDDDYLKLIGDLKHYIDYDLKFKCYSVDTHSNFRYPVFSLYDVEIHCNHAESVEKAVDDWNRRVGLINWDNLFVEMYTKSECIAHRFDEVNLYDKMICFIPTNVDVTELNKGFRLELMQGHKAFWETVLGSARLDKVGSYNIVDLLMHGKIVRRVE